MDALERKYSISLAQLDVDAAQILKYLGYAKIPFEQGVEDYIHSLIEEASEKLDIFCGIRWEPDWICKFSADSVNFNAGNFKVGSKIVEQIASSETVAVYFATLGKRFDMWSQGLFAIDDPMAGFISNAIGSVILESSELWFEEQIAKYFRSHSKKQTNRFKPGTCGWDSDDQKLIIDLMSSRFSEVSLSPTGVVIPLKSSCGIIGIGADSVYAPYPCDDCDVESCFLRSLRNARN